MGPTAPGPKQPHNTLPMPGNKQCHTNRLCKCKNNIQQNRPERNAIPNQLNALISGKKNKHGGKKGSNNSSGSILVCRFSDSYKFFMRGTIKDDQRD